MTSCNLLLADSWALTMWDVNNRPGAASDIVNHCWALTMWDVNYIKFMYSS